MVETVKNEKFVRLGYVEVTIEEVEKIIDATHDIKDKASPWTIAKQKAQRKWPDASVIIVRKVYE